MATCDMKRKMAELRQELFDTMTGQLADLKQANEQKQQQIATLQRENEHLGATAAAEREESSRLRKAAVALEAQHANTARTLEEAMKRAKTELGETSRRVSYGGCSKKV